MTKKTTSSPTQYSQRILTSSFVLGLNLRRISVGESSQEDIVRDLFLTTVTYLGIDFCPRNQSNPKRNPRTKGQTWQRYTQTVSLQSWIRSRTSRGSAITLVTLLVPIDPSLHWRRNLILSLCWYLLGRKRLYRRLLLVAVGVIRSSNSNSKVSLWSSLRRL